MSQDIDNYLLACGVQMPGQGPIARGRVNGQNMNLQQFQDYVKKQKRVKGYLITLSAGTQIQDLSISGDARMLLGFAFLESSDPAGPIPATGCTLTINNEIIVENVNPNFFSYALTDNEFYFYPRPLTGRDKIALSIEATGTASVSFAIFYL